MDEATATPPSPNLQQIEHEVASKLGLTGKKKAGKKRVFLPILIALFLVAGIGMASMFVYLNANNKSLESIPQTITKALEPKEPTVVLKTDYQNPFDSKTNYNNPFSEYVNPFNSLK
jgi:hypothetical protein